MSNAPPSPDPSNDDRAASEARSLPISPGRASAALQRPIRAIAFWCAALLPLAYLPLLAVGLDTRLRASAFVLLVGAHVVTLVLGRSYRAE